MLNFVSKLPINYTDDVKIGKNKSSFFNSFIITIFLLG